MLLNYGHLLCMSGNYNKQTPSLSSTTKLGELHPPVRSTQFKHLFLKLSPGRVEECVGSTNLNRFDAQPRVRTIALGSVLFVLLVLFDISLGSMVGLGI